MRLAHLQAEIDGLKQVLDLGRQRAEEARQRAEEIREERDRWAKMAEAAQRQITDMSKSPSGFLGWFKRIG